MKPWIQRMAFSLAIFAAGCSGGGDSAQEKTTKAWDRRAEVAPPRTQAAWRAAKTLEGTRLDHRAIPTIATLGALNVTMEHPGESTG